MLLYVIFAILSAPQAHNLLPDNAPKLWASTYRTWRIQEMRARRGPDLRSPSECDADLREDLRSFGKASVRAAKVQIESYKKYIRENENSVDPIVQLQVLLTRSLLTIKQRDLKWSQQLADVPDRGPIRIYRPKVFGEPEASSSSSPSRP